MLDPISDMLTRIRNAQKAGHKEVLIPASNLKMAIVEILEKENLVEFIRKEKSGNFENIIVGLKYNNFPDNNQAVPAISEINRISKEGQRIYVGKKDIKKIKNGYGISIISTSRGVMTGKDARQNGLGGELICEIW
jgi:small subunit ribosomal protein S8